MDYAVIFILFAAVIFFAAKFYFIKKQIKSISEQLDDCGNKVILIELADKNLEEMTAKINSMIDNIQRIKVHEAKRSSTLKSSIADISHDMRTPLTSVIGYLQLVNKECTDDNIRGNIDIALERADYCNRLINDFFELSVIDSQGCTPILGKVDIAGLLCEQILANYPSFSARNITPHFKEADVPVFVSADKNMLTRIIQNLLSNSIKYTSGDIDCNISVGDNIIMTVSNSTNERNIDTDRIFDKFFRQEESRIANGSGLGLYICRQFAESMGGGIEAKFESGVLNIILMLNKA